MADDNRPDDDRNDSDEWDEVDAEYELDDIELLELSESQLREEYDNEEINRFLTLFASNVNEVQTPIVRKNEPRAVNESEGNEQASSYESYSEEVAQRFIVPHLPPAQPPVPVFTLGRLRLTSQRLYLSTVPAYAPFFSHLLKLAVWKDRERSAFYCSVYWILWYYNLLLPALIIRVLFCLVRRRVLPYPTATELRDRQIEIDQAKEIGDEFSARLASGTLFSFDIQDMWHFFRAATRSAKSKSKKREKLKRKKAKREAKGKEKAEEEETPSDDGADIPTVTVETTSGSEERDLRLVAMQFADGIADIHERIHNLFIWRRPGASFRYGVFIFICLLLTLLLPAQYIAKLVYFIIGVLFWHVAPVIAALPSEDRARLPPPLADIPTDADYAMELISQRVNAGMPVQPRRKRRRARSTKAEDDMRVMSPSPLPRTPEPSSDSEKKINWKKWGGRAARGKAWAVDNRLIGGKKEWPQESSAPQTPLVPPAATAIGRPHSPVESHSTFNSFAVTNRAHVKAGMIASLPMSAFKLSGTHHALASDVLLHPDDVPAPNDKFPHKLSERCEEEWNAERGELEVE
ncbi:hypothetical protein V5O48_000439 [Marasmius crinis-equi]|uniref:Peroxin domain-containing protein n=1 Tax=Marasmius crinis-equi TaxID=585013 RepID=A0ABR3G1U3_9AGAR